VEQARRIARDWYAAIVQGRDPSRERQTKRDAPKVSELLHRFLEDHSKNHNQPSTVRKNHRLINSKIIPALGDLKVSEVTSADISAFHSQLAKTPIEANRCLSLLSTAFRLAIVWGIRSSGNPVIGLQKYPEKSRDRILTADELGRLGKAFSELEKSKWNPFGISAIRLAALTGWRIGEVLSLRWEDVNFNQLEAKIRGKTGKRKAVLPAPVAQLINNIPRTEEFVFPGRSNSQHLNYAVVRRIWAESCNLANITNARLHDLRHGAATLGASLGASAHILRDLLGHRSLAMSNRYVSQLLDPVRQYSEKVAQQIAIDLDRDSTKQSAN